MAAELKQSEPKPSGVLCFWVAVLQSQGYDTNPNLIFMFIEAMIETQ